MASLCKLTLFQHACFSLEDEDVKLLVDPWFIGSVFNNGWRLENEIIPSLTDLSKINYVYITHEHPDHFNIQTLKILNNYWNPIFIVQKTQDRRVANYIDNVLRKKVVEMDSSEEISISRQISLKVFSHGHMDSFALIKANKHKILNVNDCVLKTKDSLKRISKRINYEQVDVLMSQYSFASFQGNKDNIKSLVSASEDHLKWVKMRVKHFSPKIFIPFASEINWAHPENEYLNHYKVNFLDVETEISSLNSSIQTLPLSKNSTTNILENLSIKRYNFACVNEVNSLQVPSTTTDLPNINRDQAFLNICRAAEKARNMLLKKNHKLLFFVLRFLSITKILQDVVIKLNIANNQIYLRLRSPLSFQLLTNIDQNKVDICMSYDSLLFCLENAFGAETLWVNSRFEIFKGHPKNFFKHFYPSILTNQGYTFPAGYIRFMLFKWRKSL